MRIGALRPDGTPLWPWLWPIEKLARDMLEYIEEGQLSSWFGEMMNMPVNIETGLVDPDRIKYTPRRTPQDIIDHADGYSYITVDPAVSQQSWADEAAVVLHTVVSGVPQVTEYIHAKGLGEEGMIKAIMSLVDRWPGTYVVGVESVALQQVLLVYFQLYTEIRGYNLHFVPILGSRTSKTPRLRVFGQALMSGEYSLAEGDLDLINQLLSFDTSKTNNLDDLIDGASMGMEMIKEYWHPIVAGVVHKENEPQTATPKENTNT